MPGGAVRHGGKHMRFLVTITENHIFDVSMLAWITAQVLKVIVELVKNRKLDFTRLAGAGGMPSSHSALVVALAASVCRFCGFASPEFAISTAFALIVMYDASGVRRAAGEQAKILNYMMEHWIETTPEIFTKELKELLGHTPMEVVAGGALGLFFGIFV